MRVFRTAYPCGTPNPTLFSANCCNSEAAGSIASKSLHRYFPTNREELRTFDALRELPFDRRNQLLTLPVHLVLRIKQCAPLVITLGFKSLYFFLTRKLIL